MRLVTLAPLAGTLVPGPLNLTHALATLGLADPTGAYPNADDICPAVITPHTSDIVTLPVVEPLVTGNMRLPLAGANEGKS